MLNLHAVRRWSRANGPGLRTVVWFQGCLLGCLGCFNPATHSPEPQMVVDVDELVQRIVADEQAIEGITVSGGEPLQQPGALLRLLSAVRSRTKFSVILFSGYTMSEIRRMPLGPPILAQVDVLIAGRYVKSYRLGRGLRGSSNQTVHLLTDRYTMEEIEKTPVAEAWIDADGNVSISGILYDYLDLTQHIDLKSLEGEGL